MTQYAFSEIEKKWRKIWSDSGLYRTDMSETDKKLYCLVMFLYPSGDRLHIGHWWNYGPTDTWARFKRMQGYRVFEPMGYDAFGLPAENYAIKVGVHPAVSTASNIRSIRKQLETMGAMYDWDREINTSDPAYYRWTQWLFLLLYRNGLAYRKKAPVNWCPSCKTVLANEQAEGGHCERCETEVVRQDLEQWFFKITEFADELLEGLDRIDWPEKTKIMQRNWIGRSEGAFVCFPLVDRSGGIDVFTTRPDTLWGVTYMVLAPEHPLVPSLTAPDRKADVDAAVDRARRQSEIDRTSTEREKTGVFTGSFCVNPVNGQKVPVWIADYVILTYGTGAVMAVPAHDERDFEFARKYGLPVTEVISPDGSRTGSLSKAYVEPGVMVNSGSFDGQPSESGKEAVIRHLEKLEAGGRKVNYRLRDWLISRQRYWGAPIPMVYCDACGVVPVPEDRLPVLLPEKVQFTGAGQSPLTTNPEWMATPCPSCGKPGRREADTMDTFVCSSWYYLRYPDPKIDTAPFDRDLAARWLPVDQYVGGSEHAVMHLLYARFLTKVLHRLGWVPFDEPFTRLVHQGVITNAGAKMSKSRGNVINPDPYVEKYGSDVFRVYLMFMGDYTVGGDWSDEGIQGVHRFLSRVWRIVETVLENPPTGAETVRAPELERVLHRTIQAVTHDLGRFQFNTSISRIMELVNALYLYVQDLGPDNQNAAALNDAIQKLSLLIAPFAPHLGEELWARTGNGGSVFNAKWPEWDASKLKVETVSMAVQINGKVRGQVEVAVGSEDAAVLDAVRKDPKLSRHLEGAALRKVIVVKNKLVNLVVQ
jgi:leucyl-tRNA synthetase